MKEAFEKIKERLVEKSNEAEAEMYRLQDEIGLMPCVYDRTDIEDCKSQAFIDAKNIVSEVEAEYGNGWIPYATGCELPHDGEKVWLSFTNEITSYVKHAWWSDNYFEWDNGRRVKETPMAWKPYDTPQPYKPTTD